MEQKKKIVQILGRSPSPNAHKDIHEARLPDEEQYIKIDKPPHWLGFFEVDFHVRTAREVQKRTDEYELECWRLYDVADKVYSKEIDGITHRLFPSEKVKVWKYKFGERSPLMLKAVREEISKGQVLFHLNSAHIRFIHNMLLDLNFDQTPVVLQQRGAEYPYYRYLRSRNPYYLYLHSRDLKGIRNVDCYFCGSRVEHDFLKERYGLKNLSYLKDGVDFGVFKPRNKPESRKELSLDPDLRTLLFVGRFARDKGVDEILKAYEQLKTRWDIQLVLVGGSKEDHLYSSAKESGAVVVERVERELLYPYYDAADLYLMPAYDPVVVNCGGFGTAPIEALAFGTPVVSDNLIHFPGSREERDRIGLLPRDQGGLQSSMEEFLKSPERFSDCRDVAKKYFDINVTVQKDLDEYTGLFRKYYQT